MGRYRVKPHQKQSIISKTLSERKNAQSLLDDDYLVVSFRHFDRNQGSSLTDWETVAKFSHTIDFFVSACSQTLNQVFRDSKCTIYGGFPPREKTSFIHPSYVPEDAKWARVHIDGIHCVIGHIVRNTFYLVFLDHDHSFYFSELKNT